MSARLDRDDRVRVYVAGGISGGLLLTPVDMTIEKIPDEAFERVQQIVKLLTAKKEELTDKELEERSQKEDSAGDFGHYVEVGNHDDAHNKLHCIFNGYFRPTPLIVAELESILKKHASLEDLKLKP